MIVPAFLVLRYMVGRGVELGGLEVNFDKWHLGVVRLIDFSAFAVLLVRLQPVMKFLAVRPLVMLGQASLQVFCAHLFFCFFGLTMMGNASMVSGWRQVLLLALTFSALLFTAKIFAKQPPKPEPRRTSPAPRPPCARTNLLIPSIFLSFRARRAIQKRAESGERPCD